MLHCYPLSGDCPLRLKLKLAGFIILLYFLMDSGGGGGEGVQRYGLLQKLCNRALER